MQRINGKRLQIAEFRILLRNRCLGIKRHLAYEMQKEINGKRRQIAETFTGSY